MKPDLDAIRARCDAATPGPWRVDGSTYDEDCNEHLAPYGLEGPNERLIWSSGGGEYSHPDMDTAQFIASCRTDTPALLAYIDMLEHMLAEERENVDTLRARVAELEARANRASYTIGETEWANRIANAEARAADLQAEAATLRHRDALLKRVHGALADMCCRVPTSIDEPVDAIIRDALARANQRFVAEYDARTSAEEWANELRAELFDWQDAVGYVLGDNWSSEDGHDAKAARKALAEWAARAQGEAPQLLAEIAELKARIVTLEAMKP